MESLYYRFASGAYAQRTVEGLDGPVEPPEGAVEISAEEYAQGLAAVEAANAEHVAELEEAAQAQAGDDFSALVAAGIPEATARRLSGYRGETD